MKKLFVPWPWVRDWKVGISDFCLIFVCTKQDTYTDGHSQAYRDSVQQAEGRIVPRLHPRLLQRQGEAHTHIHRLPIR